MLELRKYFMLCSNNGEKRSKITKLSLTNLFCKFFLVFQITYYTLKMLSSQR